MNYNHSFKNKIKQIFRPKQERKVEMNKIYTDRYGNKFYEYKDPRQLPGPRLRVAEIAAVEADLSITAEKGCELIEAWVEFANKGDFTQASAIAVELYRRFKALAEEETLLRLASAYFVMNDEDEGHYIGREQRDKFDAWDMDPDSKDFFLSAAMKLTGFYGNTSTEDILKYLKEEQPRFEKAATFLKKFSPTNT